MKEKNQFYNKRSYSEVRLIDESNKFISNRFNESRQILIQFPTEYRFEHTGYLEEYKTEFINIME